jgi:hypothetical protein
VTDVAVRPSPDQDIGQGLFTVRSLGTIPDRRRQRRLAGHRILQRRLLDLVRELLD